MYWASGGKQVIDETQKDAAAFGVKIKEQPKEETDFEVFDENWDIVNMFLRCQTQWNTSFGGVVGLKYEVLLLAGGLFDIYHVDNRQEMLAGLQLMEAVAVKKLNSKEQ